MKSTWKSLILTGILSISLSCSAFAACWQVDATGSRYQNDDGTYPANCWQWIDDDFDGIAECYYFNQDGYMLTDATTPDGWIVNTDGTWIIDGIVQTQTVTEPAAPSQPQEQDFPVSSQNNTNIASSQNTTGISLVPYDGYTIIVNTNTKKYHVPGCSSVKAMNQENIGYADDAAYLASKGYVPCKRCH